MANRVGNNNANILTGTAQDDSFQARGGADTINGLAGNDTIDAGPGSDTASGGAGDDVIATGLGADTALGGGDNDVIATGPGTDTAGGGGGNDNIDAGTGADTLNGDLGDNTLTGGADADTFVVDIGRPGSDTVIVADFQDGTDQIHLLSNGAALGTAAVNAFVNLADDTAPVNALNDADGGPTNPAVVAAIDGFSNNDVVQLDFFLVPNLIADVGSDFLTVAGVPQLDLSIQAGGTDLFLV